MKKVQGGGANRGDNQLVTSFSNFVLRSVITHLHRQLGCDLCFFARDFFFARALALFLSDDHGNSTGSFAELRPAHQMSGISADADV